MKRKATANWTGTGKEGSGTLSTESGVLKQTPYTYKTRFENEKGTNPEELIAAAHSGCFTMKLTFVLQEAGFKATQIETQCEITFEDGVISHSHLNVTAEVPDIDPEKFEECLRDAAENCPVSQVLTCEISLEYQLQ